MTTTGGLFSNKTATPGNTARAMSRTLRIGDVQPFVSGESRELTKFANRRIGTIAKAAQRASTNEGVSRAKKIMGEATERDRMRTDPFEVAADELRLLIERVERLEEEKKALGDDIKDVYAEAKSRGYDTKTMRAVIRLRKMENHVRREAEALLETYKAALGMDYAETPLGRATVERAAAH